MYLTLTPAYGRDYKSPKEVQEAWDAGNDFQISDISSPYNGRYMNNQDAPKGSTLKIRFKRLANVKVIKVK